MIVPEGWSKCTLGDIISIKNGFAFKSSFFVEEGFYKLMTPGHFFEEGGFRDIGSKQKYYSGPIPKGFVLKKGALLIALTEQAPGLLASSAIIPEQEIYLHNQRLGLVTVTNGTAHNKFVYHLFNHRSVRKEVSASAGGTKVKHTSSEKVYAVPILLPPVDEQKAIAAILSTWDRAIEKTEALIAAKERRKKWLMQQLLTGRVRFGECGAASRDGSPKDWFTCRIEDVCKRVTRKNTTGETHVLTASGENGLVDQREYFNRAVAGESLENYYLLRKGEFAYNRSSMNGYPYGAIKRLDRYDAGILSTLYICFAVKRGEADSDFLQQYFDSPILNKELREITQIGARAHGLLNVSAREFMRLKICIPGLSEQQRIATCLGSAAREIICLRSSLATLKEQKKGLMQQLLTGKVRVKVN